MLLEEGDPLSQLPPLREVIRLNNLCAKKSLGQNFLLDFNIMRKIVRAAGDVSGRSVIEIGPGPGGLTRSILEAGAAKVFAIERDPRCVHALEEIVKVAQGRLQVMQGDALNMEIHGLGEAPRKIIANLPYNIATVLLLQWVDHITAFESLTLMFQKEVADRLVAKPGSKSYGRLSVLIQWVADVSGLFDLSPKVFTPPPKVTSRLVHIKPLGTPRFTCQRADLEKVTRAAFSQRRKMLRVSLKQITPRVEALLEKTSISATARAEELSLEEFCRLAQNYQQA